MTRNTTYTHTETTYSTTQMPIEPSKPSLPPQAAQFDPVLIILATAVLLKTTFLAMAVLFRVILAKKP